MTFTAVIVGRPNVGKSTLFNRLVGRRSALVDDTPGVTRDRREGEARLGKHVFKIVDTAGLEEAFDESLEARMRRQTEAALTKADVALFMIDAREGVTAAEQQLARWLRRTRVPVIVLANKCEGDGAIAGAAEAHKLGMGDPIQLSAEHNLGMDDLLAALKARGLTKPAVAARKEEWETEPDGDAPDSENADAEDSDPGPVRLTVVGRPNVGKSTLVNKLIGEERLLTSAEAGTTRDAIELDWTHRGQKVKLIDTAGLRRRANIVAKLEKLSTSDTLKAIRYSHVVILAVDADQILEKQDLTIARMVVEEGRALVIAVNKWDKIKDSRAAQAMLRDRLEASLPQVKGVAAVHVSALTGRGLDKLMGRVFDAYEVWNRRVPTPQINRWLEEVTQRHPPPLVDGRTIKLRYATQIKVRPPTIQLFASKPKELPDSYQRYLVNSLREVFDLPGTPIRVVMRKSGKNPFAPR